MKTIFNFFGIIVLSFAIFSGCQENPSDPASVNSDQMSLSKGRIIHHVSVGGCDITPPGEDANFSLVANMDVNGNVSRSSKSLQLRGGNDNAENVASQIVLSHDGQYLPIASVVTIPTSPPTSLPSAVPGLQHSHGV